MDGLLLIDKPKGITSTRVVELVRKKLKEKVGHTGTLDPIATGLLLLLVGKATRFSWLFLNLDKSYRVVGELGLTTDTYDLEGKVIERREVSVDCESIKRVLGKFRGEIEQVPPKFSAKKVKGKRAYKLARRGEEVELKPVKVKVHSLELTRCTLPHFEVRTTVSSGTYVRTLIHDIGQALGVGATVVELRRTAVDGFRVEDAPTLEDFLSFKEPGNLLIPTDKALSFLPSVSLGSVLGSRLVKGNSVPLEECDIDGYVRVYISGKFVGVGTVKECLLKPERLMASA